MKRLDLQRKIDTLRQERKRTKKLISRLEEGLSRRNEKLTLPFQEEEASGSRVTERTENTLFLKRRLKVSEWINKLMFQNEEVIIMDDDSSKYIVDAVTGFVAFHFECTVKECLNKEMKVSVLRVTYVDSFHNAELANWSNKCVRKNSFQELIRGLVSYAEWFENRMEIINWLIEEHGSHFSVMKLKDDGLYSITAKNKAENTNYFSCRWTICWCPEFRCMGPYFTVRITNKSNFYRENEYTLKKFASVNLSFEEINEIWRTLATAVVAENGLAQSSM